ncbi:hypothetical protein ACPXCG_03130 [Gordonia sp. DT218]|uniref:hypothetical protein n=1 Tax=unclassified Gordonia (in: high G+C Gram-positive bacteria) TaxID=2657482 RepID=UPI003CF3BFAC
MTTIQTPPPPAPTNPPFEARELAPQGTGRRIPGPMWVIARLGSRSLRRGERRAFRYYPDAAI